MIEPFPLPSDVLVAASHARLSSRIGQWLVHDIRSPLQGITLTLALLAEAGADGTPVDAGLKDALGATAGEFARILDLTERIFRLPRLDTEPVPVPPGDVLDACAEFLAHRRPRSALGWPEPGAVANLPAVRSTPDQLLHVTLALSVCAMDAAGAGPAAAVSVRVASTAGGVELRIDAAPAADVAVPDPLLLEASRLLLERSGGALDAPAASRGLSVVARLARWSGEALAEQ